MLFRHPVEYPLLKVQLFLLIQKKIEALIFFQKNFSRKRCTGVVQFRFNNASAIFPQKVPKNFGQRPKRIANCTNFSRKSSPTVPVDPYQADLTKTEVA